MEVCGRRQLDISKRSLESRDFEAGLRRKIVGQDEAVQAVVDLYQVFRAGLNSPGRPVGNLLFLGPTGAGRTRVVEATAEVLFGDPRAVIKVDCAEFQHSHEIAKLIGSPPGYLGHRETHPLITQEALARTREPCKGRPSGGCPAAVESRAKRIRHFARRNRSVAAYPRDIAARKTKN